MQHYQVLHLAQYLNPSYPGLSEKVVWRQLRLPKAHCHHQMTQITSGMGRMNGERECCTAISSWASLALVVFLYVQISARLSTTKLVSRQTAQSWNANQMGQVLTLVAGYQSETTA